MEAKTAFRLILCAFGAGHKWKYSTGLFAIWNSHVGEKRRSIPVRRCENCGKKQRLNMMPKGSRYWSDRDWVDY